MISCNNGNPKRCKWTALPSGLYKLKIKTENLERVRSQQKQKRGKEKENTKWIKGITCKGQYLQH